MLGISHYVVLIWTQYFYCYIIHKSSAQCHVPLRGFPGAPSASPLADGESSGYASVAGMRRALNAGKRLIEADILNEAENILYKT